MSALHTHSSNILLDGEMHAKISDFGMAKKMPLLSKGKSFVKVNEACGTAGYQAPEYLRGEMGPKLDVYSFGVVCELNGILYHLNTTNQFGIVCEYALLGTS